MKSLWNLEESGENVLQEGALCPGGDACLGPPSVAAMSCVEILSPCGVATKEWKF